MLIVYIQVDSKAKPAFPRQTSVWWFDCKSAQNTPTLGLSADLRSGVNVHDGHDGGDIAIGEVVPRQPVTINENSAGLSSNRFEINRETEFVSPKQLRGHQNPEERFLTHESEHELHEHDRSFTNPHLRTSNGTINHPEDEENHNSINNSNSSKSLFNSFNFTTLISMLVSTFFVVRLT